MREGQRPGVGDVERAVPATSPLLTCVAPKVTGTGVPARSTGRPLIAARVSVLCSTVNEPLSVVGCSVQAGRDLHEERGPRLAPDQAEGQANRSRPASFRGASCSWTPDSLRCPSRCLRFASRRPRRSPAAFGPRAGPPRHPPRGAGSNGAYSPRGPPGGTLADAPDAPTRLLGPPRRAETQRPGRPARDQAATRALRRRTGASRAGRRRPSPRTSSARSAPMMLPRLLPASVPLIVRFKKTGVGAVKWTAGFASWSVIVVPAKVAAPPQAVRCGAVGPPPLLRLLRRPRAQRSDPAERRAGSWPRACRRARDGAFGPEGAFGSGLAYLGQRLMASRSASGGISQVENASPGRGVPARPLRLPYGTMPRAEQSNSSLLGLPDATDETTEPRGHQQEAAEAQHRRRGGLGDGGDGQGDVEGTRPRRCRQARGCKQPD